MFLKTQNVSEKIKNEILPLLNGADDDIDELDDEVAMISNKKGDNAARNNNDLLNTDDIKIEIKQTDCRKAKQTENNKKNVYESKQEEETDGRNFNTFPRNYSEGKDANKQ